MGLTPPRYCSYVLAVRFAGRCKRDVVVGLILMQLLLIVNFRWQKTAHESEIRFRVKTFGYM